MDGYSNELMGWENSWSLNGIEEEPLQEKQSAHLFNTIHLKKYE